MTTVEVISAGPLTTIQDLGRPGWAHIGVPRSGAADRESLKLANRLVGNREGAAALETTLAGPQLRFTSATTVALTGALVSARVDHTRVAMNTAVDVGAGDVLKIGNAKVGLRTYIAFAGGLDVPLVLGSVATDMLTGLGPPAVAHGDILMLARGDGPNVTVVSPIFAPAEVPELHVVLGPRAAWFTAEAVAQLTADPFTVTPDSNRVGLRLDGPRLERARSEELPSEGVIPGAIQVPAGGRPILLLTDHPTTGGYPVIAVVVEADLQIAAQLRPGQQLRFSC